MVESVLRKSEVLGSSREHFGLPREPLLLIYHEIVQIPAVLDVHELVQFHPKQTRRLFSSLSVSEVTLEGIRASKAFQANHTRVGLVASVRNHVSFSLLHNRDKISYWCNFTCRFKSCFRVKVT